MAELVRPPTVVFEEALIDQRLNDSLHAGNLVRLRALDDRGVRVTVEGITNMYGNQEFRNSVQIDNQSL